MKRLLRIIFTLSVILIAACTQAQPKISTVSGELILYLHPHNPVGMYARFELKQETDGKHFVDIASSGFKKITENPVVFSLPFSSSAIDSQNRYRFFATVTDDLMTEKEIAAISIPVITHGFPSVVKMAIQPVRKPVE